MLSDIKFPPPPLGKSGWPWTEESDPLPSAMPDGNLWPKITIVTPSFNQGEFLEETIRSVLLQNYPNLEYIVIDGGSTDGSLEIIQRYAPWLTSWVSEADHGQSHAIRKGFEKATGSWGNWLNSDDFLLPNALRNVSARIAAISSSVKVIIFNLRIVNYQSTPIKEVWQARAPRVAADFLRRRNVPVIPQPATFLRRELIQVDESLHYIMDWVLYFGIAERFPAAFLAIPEEIAAFRLHEASKTITCREKFADEFLSVLSRRQYSSELLRREAKKKIAEICLEGKITRIMAGDARGFRLLALSVRHPQYLLNRLYLGAIRGYWFPN